MRLAIRVWLLAALAALGCGGDGTGPPSRPDALPLRNRPLTAGHEHACAIATDGVAYCWGRNADSRLGVPEVGTFDVRTAPTRVQTALRFAAISAGFFHTCALTADGAAYCWGRNDAGQLGDGGAWAAAAAPVAVRGGLRFSDLSVGAGHSCGVTASRELYCWGTNIAGQLGAGDDVPIGSFRATPVHVAEARPWVAVEAGQLHTCALDADGRAFCWGANNWGQAGTGTAERLLTRPVEVVGGRRWSRLAAGDFHTCGITPAGEAFCWGEGNSGQLGDGQRGSAETTVAQTTPSPVAGGRRWSEMAPGRQHSCGLDAAGAALCWGYDVYGELGAGGLADVRAVPVPVASDAAFGVIDSGAYFSCAIAVDGRLYCWGTDNVGQIGVGGDRGQPVSVPTEVAGGLRFGGGP